MSSCVLRLSADPGSTDERLTLWVPVAPRGVEEVLNAAVTW